MYMRIHICSIKPFTNVSSYSPVSNYYMCYSYTACFTVVCYGVLFWKGQTQPVQSTYALSATNVSTCGAYKTDHVRLVNHNGDSTKQPICT